MKITFEEEAVSIDRHRKKLQRISRCLFSISLLFALLGFGFFCSNLYEGYQAGKTSGDLLGNWDSTEIVESGDEKVKFLDKNAYIGILEIPSLGVTLPVNQSWDPAAAKISPCRYTGSVSDSNLVIAAHNYATHFGNLKHLKNGDLVTFTDILGITYQYEVSGMEILEGTDVEKMKEGDWDLTLFTCTIGGKQRVTVRCQYADGIS